MQKKKRGKKKRDKKENRCTCILKTDLNLGDGYVGILTLFYLLQDVTNLLIRKIFRTTYQYNCWARADSLNAVKQRKKNPIILYLITYP